jgi:hypothetical protein
MSRSAVIRRTTAAVALLAVLALALPAGAAPVRRQAPAPVASVGFFDQVLTWLGLWSGPTTATKPPVRTKALSTSGSTTSSMTSGTSSTDRGGAIDPWGGS